MSWRRNAFRVSDYLNPTSTMKFQFIASDSTVVGAYLDGGSLIEAAVDDFVVYDALIIGVEENEQDENRLTVYPNPTKDQINLNLYMAYPENGVIRIHDVTGRIVYEQKLNVHRGYQVNNIALPTLTDGIYDITFIGEKCLLTEQFFIRK